MGWSDLGCWRRPSANALPRSQGTSSESPVLLPFLPLFPVLVFSSSDYLFQLAFGEEEEEEEETRNVRSSILAAICTMLRAEDGLEINKKKLTTVENGAL